MKLFALDIFNFTRGAIRGFYGIEDFRNKSFLICGGDEELLSVFSLNPESKIYFKSSKATPFQDYIKVVKSKLPVTIWEGEYFDIKIDVENKTFSLNDKEFSLLKLGEDPYTQGIHEYYPIP